MKPSSTENAQRFTRFRDDCANFARGVCMGGVDAIPGVSGGTVALILGIYARLVTAISHFDRALIAKLRAGRWRQAAEHVDLRFLAALGAGIATGVICLVHAMNFLLTDETARPFTLAVFFGAIVASTWLVGKTIRVGSGPQFAAALALALLGARVAFELTLLSPSEVSDPSLLYLFCCGLIAICAMILPGISGSYLLLVLGVYLYLTGVLKAVTHGDIDQRSVLEVAAFCSGCAIGLLAFSKFLRWLLARHYALTMATLCGFMLGALRRVWPFQELTETALADHPQVRLVLPDALGAHSLGVFATMAAATIAVLLVDYFIRCCAARRVSGNAPGGARVEVETVE